MKEFLSENGIPIENRDCTNDLEAQNELRDLGIKALPVAVSGSKIVVGFDEKKLIETFEIKKEIQEPLSAESILNLTSKVFKATKLAINQIPQEKLDWISPDRPRTLRQLTWHIYERFDLCMEAYDSESYTEDMVRRYEKEANNYKTNEEICLYGNKIENKLQGFIEEKDRDVNKEINSYMGRITVNKLLEMALGHGVQHLRHTYHYFKMLGIIPDSPLMPEDYKDIPVPKELF
ncbi:MAG: DinB family protein [Nitrospinota bacterium]|nr:DinB family protein [Nitrospinota bacterium]